MDQPVTTIRKNLLNALLVDLAALQKEAPGSGAVFPVVSKYFYQIPNNQPALYLANTQTDVIDPNNLNFDDLNVGFAAYVYVTLEGSLNSAAMAAKIDQLVDCEAYLYKFIGKVPTNVDNVTGVKVYNSQFVRANYSETNSPTGRALELAFEFDLSVNVNVQLITS